jgi:hypothetical protein
MLIHKRALGDTLSPLPVQLRIAGEVVDLTSKTVKFSLVDEEGTVIVAETSTGVTISVPLSGYAEYDFQSADVDAAGTYYGFFHVYSGSERDTYQPDGIKIIVVSPTVSRVEDTTPDILALAQSPKRTRTDEGTVEERPIQDIIDADRYTKSATAQGAVPYGLRIAKTLPPGTV